MNELRYSRYEKRGHVAYVTIRRPEAMNALHNEAHSELATIWDDFAADDNMRVGVLTGEVDRAFCAGRDLKSLAGVLTGLMRGDGTEFERVTGEFARISIRGQSTPSGYLAW